jgi:hypothetical protein
VIAGLLDPADLLSQTPTYCRGHQLFAGTPTQGFPMPGRRGMANICTWVRGAIDATLALQIKPTEDCACDLQAASRQMASAIVRAIARESDM